jgi:hypothetical protein
VALHGSQSPFDVAVVGLNAVIRVAAGSMTAGAAELAFLLQFSNGRGIASQSVSGAHVWRPIIGIGQSSLQEAFGGFPIAGFG